MTLLWTAWALAAPTTWTLDNGVRVILDATGDGSGRAGAAWIAAVGSEDGPVGATATALASLHTGSLTAGSPDPAAEWAARHTGVPIDGADPDAVDARWVALVGAPPTDVLDAHTAGTALDVASEHLDAWAWLASDALAAPVLRDLPRARAAAREIAPRWTPVDAVHAAPDRRAPVTAEALDALDAATVSLQVDRLADPRHLVVAVVGDVTVPEVHAAVDRAFGRLTPRAGRGPAPASPGPGIRHVDTVGEGPSRWAARLGDGRGAALLYALLADPLRDALLPLATQLRIGADADGLWLAADLAPGVSPDALTDAVDRVLDAPLLPDAAERARAIAALATPDDRAARAVALATRRPVPLDEALAAARRRRTFHAHTASPDDPELAALAPLARELVRLRLDHLAALPPEARPAALEALEVERDAVAPGLRPALDLLLRRARERWP